MTSDHAALIESLRRMGLADKTDAPAFVPLTGGVSTDIWRVDLASRRICVKRALPKLKVAADWHAPIGRNASEVAWIEQANAIVPGSAPEILGHDPEAGLFAMPFYDPADYRLWKSELRDGRAEVSVAAAVGASLGRIHAATADKEAVVRDFANDDIFYDIRLEPYLVATGRAHADLADIFNDLAANTAATKKTLVHGDVSPKNILLGPAGPMFVDAECAWYGDPAFDVAFCLNHLLLKCLWTPDAALQFLDCFDAMAQAYRRCVDWEPKDSVEARAAHLLPGLFLARVDGKSPVEYVTADADKDRVRRVARALLMRPVAQLSDVKAAWREELGL